MGYAGGFTPNPTYQEVCSGKTGHTEAVQVVYDPSLISFADILRWMWEAHDPCSGMGQGNDRGTQYRSAFYWFDDEQKALILASKGAYEAALGRTITTECAAASDYDKYGGCFFYAEDQHQQYLAKPGARPYCSAKPRCVSLPPFESWAPEELQARHAPARASPPRMSACGCSWRTAWQTRWCHRRRLGAPRNVSDGSRHTRASAAECTRAWGTRRARRRCAT